MAESVNPREKRAAIAAIFFILWPLCGLALYSLLIAGVIDPEKIQAWLGDKLPLRFLRDSYRDSILAWVWIPLAAAFVAYASALGLAPGAVSRYGHLAFLGLPAGFTAEDSQGWRWFRKRRKSQSADIVRYRFSSQAMPFLGRGDELRSLDDFLAKQQNMLWWWIIGGAATGKSRMALEWVLSLQGRSGGLFARTDAGFLLRSAGGNSWQDWEPRRPTVIVVDDASSRADEVKAILRSLCEQQSQFRFPVRVLLVDRNVHESFRELNGDPICGAARYKEPLNLAGLPDCIDALAEAIASRSGQPFTLTEHGRERILQLTGGSPLFMCWALESIARKGEPDWADKEGILRPQIDRFESQVKQLGLSESCFPLLALSTLTRGSRGRRQNSSSLISLPRTPAA